jgi:hypothetical protein
MRAFFAEVKSLRDEVAADGARLSVLVVPFRFQLATASWARVGSLPNQIRYAVSSNVDFVASSWMSMPR